MWISFEDIKKAVSLEMVLDHYKVELRKANPNTLRGKCPLPTHGSETSRASFTATLTKGVGGAWACQSHSCIAARDGKKGGNALDLVAAMEQCSIRDAAMKMRDWFNVAAAEHPEPETARPAGKTDALVSKKNNETEEVKNRALGFELRGIVHGHPYLADRGVSEEVARAFGIGFFSGRGSMSGRIVFPIHNEKGELVAYAGRAIDGSEPKYKFPAGFHKSLELYNLHRVIGEQRIVLVEGFFDCLRVTAAGFPCVALMGSSMSQAQEEFLVRHFKVACILLDGDVAGQQAATEILLRLGRRMCVWVPMLTVGTQPDMMRIEELQSLLQK